jgi:hypothetical protein
MGLLINTLGCFKAQYRDGGPHLAAPTIKKSGDINFMILDIDNLVFIFEQFENFSVINSP